LLERVYAFEVHYSRLPMIYNSFVARAAVARVRDRYGRYFFGTSPDVTSGIVNAVICDRFLQSSRPLSVAGISRHSNGYRLTQFATAANADDLERDFPLLVSDDPAVSTNLEYAISTDLELVRRELLGGEDLQLDRRGLVRSIASAINNNPARYDQTLALVQRLLTKYELDAELLWIPPRLERPDVLRVGPHMRGAGEVLFVIDGTEAGLSSIADAVRLLSQLVPHCDSIVPSFDVEDEGPPLVSVEPLGFSKGDTGVRALASGWGEPESWGTWTTDRLSTMRLLLPKRRRNARLVLRYRTIPLPNDADRILRCESNGRIVGEWRLSGAKAKGELRIELPTAQPGVPVEVVFINPNSRSPAELGIGRDVRPLGLGVEQIRLMG
jgi:hypothetical protein